MSKSKIEDEGDTEQINPLKEKDFTKPKFIQRESREYSASLNITTQDIIILATIIVLIVIAGVNTYIYISNESRAQKITEREKAVVEKLADLAKRDHHVDERRPDADEDIERRRRLLFKKDKLWDRQRNNLYNFLHEYNIDEQIKNLKGNRTTKDIHIAYNLNLERRGDDYYQPVASVVSLCENANVETKYKIHLLHTISDEDRINKIFGFILDTYPNCEIISHNLKTGLTTSLPENFRDDYAFQITLLEKIIPATVQKIIVLDENTYVLEDLLNLYNIDINKYLIAGHAINDYNLEKFKSDFKVEREPELFVDTQVALWNLEMMRKEKIMNKILKFLKENEGKELYLKKYLPGTFLMNYACEGKITKLPAIYGMKAYKDYEDAVDSNNQYEPKEYMEAFAGPAIVNYDEEKELPNLIGNMRPYGMLFFKYLNKTDNYQHFMQDLLTKLEEVEKDKKPEPEDEDDDKIIKVKENKAPAVGGEGKFDDDNEFIGKKKKPEPNRFADDNEFINKKKQN